MTPTASPWALDQDAILTDGVLSRRVAGCFVDWAIIGLLLGCGFVFGAVFGVLTLGLGLPLFGWLPLLPLLYTWLTIASPLSATPGQALFGLVVRRDDDLGRPTVAQALVSAFGYYLTVAIGVVWVAVALLTTRRRTLHDLASGLVVVRARALTPPASPWAASDAGWTAR